MLPPGGQLYAIEHMSSDVLGSRQGVAQKGETMAKSAQIRFWGAVLMAISSLFFSRGLPYAATADNSAEPGGFCSVGQTWPGYDPAWIEPGTISGNGQTFCVLIEPGEGCACSLGYQVSTVDFFLGLPDDSPTPLTISVSMGLKDVIPDPAGIMPWVPGETLCETPVRAFTFFIPKSYVGFGIALDCNCAAIEGPAFLFFTVHSELDPPGGLYTTGGGAPTANQSLAVIGGQWVDLTVAGILTRGDLVVSGSARCCEFPIATTDESWGSLKARYRN